MVRTKVTLEGQKGYGKEKFDPNKQQMDETTESFTNFIVRYRNSPATKSCYADWLRRFVWYSNLPQIKTKTRVDVGDNTDMLLFDDPRKIQNHIKQYLTYLYDHLHLSPRSVRSYYIAVKHFYETNEIVLNWRVIRDYVGSASNIKSNLDMPYTYEEIHKMLDRADERKRVIILLLASTGMRRGAIPLLKYGDLKWIEQYQIYEITVYKGFKEEYITYCSLECSNALNSYFDYRRRYGENITKDSYVIRKQFNRKNHSGVLSKVSDANDPPELHRVSEGDIEHHIYDLVYSSGIRSPQDKKKRLGDRHRNMLNHSFRKFFENRCLAAGIESFYVFALMGHGAKMGVEKSYYRQESIQGENSLLELYVKKAMPNLTISNESRLKLKNRELEIRMKEDEQRFKRALEERESKFDTLAAQIEALNKKLGLS